MRPNAAFVISLFGPKKLSRFSTSNASFRNSIRARSVTANHFVNAPCVVY